ncbi:MAG TPA: hypothetical protein PL093_02080 [Candidatus Pacearchaeota archaeon]|nr:hypothetical protein [Candidatus Pacearchaeota archaeon]HRR45729.1 hypothetical protein [Candidatus Paceibacterota bacterium]HQG09399.1 hypothetical protein [Candidatus Pacearchaeota archaeon]HQH20343.1 hypothetical protein [Candidatus Pacearchaeota archaeon]HQK58647.1 hypothetical protein [Candidatus Pacearchaeota archaeon]
MIQIPFPIYLLVPSGIFIFLAGLYSYVNTYPSGVGIGLYFASEIVKAHQGRIWAESAGINQGSTFYVELKTKE